MAGSALAEIDRIAPTHEPAERPIGYQVWTDLTFLHWRMRASEVEPLIPEGLTLDTYDGFAWIGLVAFGMSGLRPWWLPALPGCSAFLETNVRTYVHRNGEGPGVWFFSLDASNSLAVHGARWRWGLLYHRATMQLSREGDFIRYRSVRRCKEKFGSEIETQAGMPLASGDSSVAPGQSVPGSLEHFLAERYILYSRKPAGPLRAAQVHHGPYPLRAASARICRESLTRAAGFSCERQPDHALFSDGVCVKFFALRDVR